MANVYGGYRIEKPSQQLHIHRLSTPARSGSTASLFLWTFMVGGVLTLFVPAMLRHDAEMTQETRYIFWVLLSLVAMTLLPVVLGLVDAVRPKTYMFDRIEGTLTVRDKPLCALKDISQVKVVRADREDYFYFYAQVLCGSKEVCRFVSDNQSMISATEQEKRDVYQLAREMCDFLGIELSATS